MINKGIYFFDNKIELKTFLFIISIFIIVIFDFFLKNYNKEYINKVINIDDSIEDSLYENNIDFSNYSTQIKAIAIYYPNYNLSYFIDTIQKCINNEIDYYKQEYPKNINQIDYSNIIIKNTNNTELYKETIIKQINLAKNHGIYGFGFYIYYSKSNNFFDEYINVFFANKNINYKFLFILNINIFFTDIILSKISNKNNCLELLNQLKDYILDKRYIKYESKPIICIDSFKNTSNNINIIQLFRKNAIILGIGELYIISSIVKSDIPEIQKLKIFDAGFESLPNYFLKKDILTDTQDDLIYFSELIYKNITYINEKDFEIYRSNLLENKIKLNNNSTFIDYSPESFYMMNNQIINYTKNNFNNSNSFIFLYSWNNYYDGFYLEPDCKYGYASINAFSKSLFNLSYRVNSDNILNFMDKILIAVQVHIYYLDLIDDIINKTNNIPAKFDLYITTNSKKKKEIIQRFVEEKSISINYKIDIVRNKGRDIFPFLIQMKAVFREYKYICHIHSKKSMHHPKLGISWRNYLYNNIIGSKKTISNILSDFEKNEKLGFIFPENFHTIKRSASILDPLLINLINYLINKMFKGYKIGNKIDFPAGNMFWSKSKAIYQIFQVNLEKHTFLRKHYIFTFLYALERIWLYIVKLNGYYYKKIFEFY